MTSGAWVLGLGLALALGTAGARAQEVLRKQYDDGSIYEGTFKLQTGYINQCRYG